MKVLAVASQGGHWMQLMRMRALFQPYETTYLTTNAGYAGDVDGPFMTVVDANLNEKLKLLRLFFEVFVVLCKVRPRIIVTTGAAPGFAALVLGRLFGARTVWIDSIANSEELSKSGVHARRFAHLWLTQWPNLAKPGGPQYWGSVL